MSCVNLRLGKTNVIPDATITASETCLTDLEYIKNEWRSRRALFNVPAADNFVQIIGHWPTKQLIDYIALPTHLMSGLTQMRVILYNEYPVTDSPTQLIYSSDRTRIADYTPLGLWQAGIDPFGIPLESDIPDMWLHWTDKTYAAKSFIVEAYFEADAVTDSETTFGHRMLLAGQKIELEQNFNYGHSLRQLTQPELEQTSSGSFIPRRFQSLGRVWDANLGGMTDGDRTKFGDFEKTQRTYPFIFSAFPDESGFKFNDYTFLGRFGVAHDLRHITENLHSTSTQIVEV